jgi:hypothetical protein
MSYRETEHLRVLIANERKEHSRAQPSARRPDRRDALSAAARDSIVGPLVVQLLLRAPHPPTTTFTARHNLLGLQPAARAETRTPGRVILPPLLLPLAVEIAQRLTQSGARALPSLKLLRQLIATLLTEPLVLLAIDPICLLENVLDDLPIVTIGVLQTLACNFIPSIAIGPTPTPTRP